MKTQIGYSANLYGFCRRRTCGGAVAFQRQIHGNEYGVGSAAKEPGYGYSDMVKQYAELMDLMPEGYAIDKQHPEIVYVPHNMKMDVMKQTIFWKNDKITWTVRKKYQAFV